MPVLVTVRHTGSHFALNLFERCKGCGRGHFVRHDSLYEPPEGDDLWFSHAEKQVMSRLVQKIQEDPPLIMTMRHPMKVVESWLKRQKPMDWSFRDSWRSLFRLKAQYEDSFWLPVDTDDRDERLAVLGARLGINLETDWMPKGVFSTDHYDWVEKMTRDQARDFLKTLPFDQFGYDLDGNYRRNTQ